MIKIKKKQTEKNNLFSLFKQKNNSRSLLGDNAENLAEDFLVRKKFKLIQANFRTKMGEIDRIMLDSRTLVFVEVRYRKNSQVSPIESVDIIKQRKLIKTAKLFLLKYPQYEHYPCRFDVVGLKDLNFSSIIWVKDAFQLEE